MIHPGSLGANVDSRIGHKIKTTNILKQRVAALNKQKYVWTTPLSIYDPRHPRYSEKVYYYNKVTKRIESKLFYQIVYELRTYAKTEAEYFAALNRGDHTVKPPKSMIEKDFVVSQFSGTSLVEHMDSIELRLKVANMLRDKSSEDFKKLGFDFEVNDLPDFNINALREFEWRLNNFEQIKIDYDNRPNIISRLQKQLSKLVSDRDKLIAERNEAIKEIPDVAISEAVKTKDIKTIDIEIEKNQKLLSLLELRKKYEGLTDGIIDRSNKRTSYTEFDKVNKSYFLAGIFDSEGYVSKSRYRLTISQANLEFIKEVIVLFNEIGIEFHGPVTHRSSLGTWYTIRIDKKDEILKFTNLIGSYHIDKSRRLREKISKIYENRDCHITT